MRRRITAKVIAATAAIAVVTSVGVVSSAANASSPEQEALTLASVSTLEKLQTGLAITIVTGNLGGTQSTTNVVANSTRYSEQTTTGVGQSGRYGIDGSAGYVTANTIPVSKDVLEAANLSPDTVVAFTAGQPGLGDWGATALPPAQKITSYYKYSPPGMWMDVVNLQATGDVRVGRITAAAIPEGGTRYTVPVESLTPDLQSYTLDLDVVGGNLSHARAQMGSGLSYTVTITGSGTSIVFPTAPKATARWGVVEAAQWRLSTEPKAVSAAVKTKNRTLAQAKTKKVKPTIALVRSQAVSVAKATKVPGTVVRAWNISGGARIEIQRAKSRGYIWTVGACITVSNNIVTSKAC